MSEHRRLLSNAGLLSLNALILAAGGYLFWVLAARLYAPSEVGVVSAALALVPLLVTLASLGLPNTVLRLVHSASDRSALMLTATLLVASASLPLAVAWLAFTPASPLRSPLGALACVVALAALVSSTVCDALIVGLRRPVFLLAESVSALLARLLSLVLLAAFAASGLMLAWLAGALVSGLVSLALAFRLLRPHRPVRLLPARALRSRAPLAGANWAAAAASALPAAVMPLVVLHLWGASQAAYASMALLAAPVLCLAAAMIARSTYAEASADPSRLWRLTRHGLLLACGAQAVVALAVLAAAPLVMGLFGPSYQAAVPLLRLLAVAALVSTASYFSDMVVHVRADALGIVVVNVAGSLALLVCALVGASVSLVGLGVGWLAGQLLYSLIGWLTVFLRSRRPLALQLS